MDLNLVDGNGLRWEENFWILVEIGRWLKIREAKKLPVKNILGSSVLKS
jgi:hypothetical protein